MKQNRQITGNVSLYHTCLELSKIGLSVTITARNAKAVDAFVHNPDSGKIASLQIKTDNTPYGYGIYPDGSKGKNKKDKTKEDAIKSAKLANFWIIVQQSGDKLVSWVCKGTDVDMMDYYPKGSFQGYRFNPVEYDKKSTIQDKTKLDEWIKKKAKWEKRKNGKGWELIKKALS